MKVAEIFGDYMVIQRGKPFNIWGEGQEGSTITVKVGRNEGQTQVKDGKWQVTLPPMEASFEEEIELTSSLGGEEGDCYKLRHVAIGEVWLAGGQSNMEYFLRYDHQWEETKNKAFNPHIRLYNCKRLAYEGEQKDVSDSGYWFREKDSAWETFSAPGYHFALVLQETLKVPIGIIGCNWGGSTASTWLDPQYLETPDLKVYLEEYKEAYSAYTEEEYRIAVKQADEVYKAPARLKEWEKMMYGLTFEEQLVWLEEHKEEPPEPIGPMYFNRPGGLYENMLKKIIPYGVKGVIWYQGETDTGHPLVYDKLFEAMASCWRKQWQDDFPFLFVQLAPFRRWLQCTGEGYALLRESQQKIADTVPNTYMVSIMDLGMADDIHPKKKKEVGERLALLARGKIYGENILCESPRINKGWKSEKEVILTFLNSGEGLYKQGTDDSALRLFKEGEELPFKTVTLEKEQMTIELEAEVKGEIEIEYAFADFVEVDIYNSAGLPLCPFRYKVEEK